MTVSLNDKYMKPFVEEKEWASIQDEVAKAHKTLLEGTGEGNDFLGWVTLPDDYDKEEFARVKKAAQKIKSMCDVFIVIGIGGSYLGARAVIEFLKSPLYNNLKKDTPDIYFSGCNISAQSMNELLEICEGKDICVNVISKSGTTTEPAVAFRIFRELLEKKYGKEGARERIFVTTDKERGTLKKFADEVGYETFVVPDNVGGRFSVLTSVGLLPIAVSGVDVDAMMEGASKAAKDCKASDDANVNDCLKYVALRNIMYRRGMSTEILVSYEPYAAMFSEWWKQLYGESEGKDGKEGAKERIFVTTDKERGTLKKFADEVGYETFVVPDNVGGRFSVLTSVGLLPIAVSGVDVDAMMQGASKAAKDCKASDDANVNDCLKYVALRNIMYRRGMSTEILVSYEPYAAMFSEWWKQLYGESEGKDGKGLFPASVVFSTDLHSLGQFIQDGKRNVFETVLAVKERENKYTVPFDEANVDGLNFLSGVDMNEVNDKAMMGTILAHVDGGTPNMVLELCDKSAYTLGYLIYFFEFACGVSGYVLDVNPFNQPGVEAYKKNMFALLGKPGYEEQKKILEERLK